MPRYHIAGRLVLLTLFLSACATPEATWKTVPQSRVAWDRAWSIVVNAISQQFELEITDAQSGYLRTGWKVTRTNLLGQPQERARVTVRVEERSPLSLKVKVEKQEVDIWTRNWADKGNHEKLEQEIMAELAGRLR